MRQLRIYDRGVPPNLIADHPDVTFTNVTQPGCLVVYLAAALGGPTRAVYAPGFWGIVEEQDVDDAAEVDNAADASALTSPGADVTFPPVVVVPGPADAEELPQRATVTDDEIRDLLGSVPPAWPLTDRDRVHIAMQVVCTCAAMRCPVVLNPSSPTERWTVKLKERLRRSDEVDRVQAEPRMQCVYLIGHDTTVTDHEWHEGGWPYGPAMHHIGCPRHPENYNRPGSVPTGEGQAYAPGITPTDAPSAVPATSDVPAPARDRLEIGTTSRVLVRPFTTALGREITRHAADDGFGYDREQVTEVADDETYLPDKRILWGVCAVPGPDSYPFPVWCTEEPRHAAGAHQMARHGGERITWLRRGATQPE